MERLCLASLVIVSVVFFVEATTPDCPPGVGEECGGFTGKICCSGLVCKLNSSCPDAGGICVLNRIGNVGDCCGGNSGKNCRAGLYCKYGSRPGANGRCVPRNCKRDRRSEGGFGEYCNFFTGHLCQPCYECYPTGEMVDDGGICLPKDCGGRPFPAECGEPCGTYTGIPCRHPLVCVLDDPNVSDGAGICLPPKKDDCQETPGAEGCFCGGIAGIRCQNGLKCKLDGNYPDAGGKCIRIKRDGGLGDMCGGIAGLTCGKGLKCDIKEPYPDASGYCVEDCDKWKNEFYTDCGSACPKTCENYTKKIRCPTVCVAGCFCKLDQVRGLDGRCINIEDCPRTECDKSKGEEFTTCGSACPKTCDNYDKDMACTLQCVEGCFCPYGTVRDPFGYCIDPKYCSKNAVHEHQD